MSNSINNENTQNSVAENVNKGRIYVAIDLKSFYASVECNERYLDPLTTNLVVADESRTQKTICLAVSPSLKAYGIPGRLRLFEVVEKVKEINAQRLKKAPRHIFSGESSNAAELSSNPSLKLSFIVAPPQMAKYMQYSADIYKIYLKYIAPEDIHVYSVDEVFMDVTDYLATYNMSARELTVTMIRDVLSVTGITATAGIGTNMFLCKVAMDIVAKHVPADKDGVRLAELNEISYRRLLWQHRPLTDFWRIGRGYSKKLESKGLYTMGDIARCSLGKPDEYYNAELLYKLFGINAELLIDHAWGVEPCRISDIKSYKPSSNSISSGQVLSTPYSFEKTLIIVREMTDSLVLELVEKQLVTDQLVLDIGFDVQSLNVPDGYAGELTSDRYGRAVPKPAHGSINLGRYSSSTKLITSAAVSLFESIVDKNLFIRRLSVTANRVIDENSAETDFGFGQLDLFTDYAELQKRQAKEAEEYAREKQRQLAILDIQKRFGKNAVIKGTSLIEGATGVSRNAQIGGHKA